MIVIIVIYFHALSIQADMMEFTQDYTIVHTSVVFLSQVWYKVLEETMQTKKGLCTSIHYHVALEQN